MMRLKVKLLSRIFFNSSRSSKMTDLEGRVKFPSMKNHSQKVRQVLPEAKRQRSKDAKGKSSF
jgi:hypothetical protein